ncbi:ScbA/BarX family gamma-butyrolactone biosynthesis protein [Micromonosporaceae bacterium Da 78-11]
MNVSSSTGVVRAAEPVGAAGPIEPAAWHRTVRPEFVHRADAAEIFPTAWRVEAPDRFTVSVRQPVGHHFFGGSASTGCDPLFFTESMRQASMLLAHAEYQVPLDNHFVMQELGWNCAPSIDEVPRTAEIHLDVVCSETGRRDGGLKRMRVDATFRHAGVVLAAAQGELRCLSARAYRRVRGDLHTARPRTGRGSVAVPPWLVGRHDDADVVLSPGSSPASWQLRVEVGHPTLFSRPNDHVPGMALLEAARQATIALDRRHVFQPVLGKITFHRYVELDDPCVIEAWPGEPGDDPDTIEVMGRQSGRTVFVSSMTRSAWSGDR